MIVSGAPASRYVWEPITLAGQLERTALAHPHRDALVDGDRRVSWQALRGEARVFARALMGRGLGKGDHFAVWLPNQVEWVVAWLAAAYVGAVMVPLNSRYKVEEAGYILRQSDARMLFMRRRFLGMDYVPMLRALAPGSASGMCPGVTSVVVVDGEPPAGTSGYRDFLQDADRLQASVLDRQHACVNHDDPLIIVYTSGTTGRPKGAVHSHRILRNECAITEWMGIDAGSRILGHMPFFHVGGGFSGICPALITGACVVIMDHWDKTRALELIAREGVTSLSGIPTHFIDLLDHPQLEQHDISTLHGGWIGGASNPREVIEGVIRRLGMERLLPVYGMTETTSVTTFPRPDDPMEVIVSGKGVPVSDFELKVVDRTDGRELGPGEEGEVCVRGHPVMQGYYRDPAATAAVMDEDGWFHTGDLGVLDEAGYLAITGRRSDMFIVGGSNTYPAEIEAVLATHPAIVQAYVVGVPHPRLGEVGFAFVQRRDERLQVGEVQDFVKARLADFKVPRHVRFVADWPLTATGKIERFRLKEMALDARGEVVSP